MTAPIAEKLAGNHSQPWSQAPGFSIKAHGVTDRGQRRPTNEDQFLIASLTQALHIQESSVNAGDVHCGEPRGQLLVVADGMGGHAAGQEASAMAVHTIEAFMVDSLNWCAGLRSGGNALLEEFQKALKRADAEMATAVRRHPEFRGMGTTVTLAYIVGNQLFIAHAGDSRCYLFRQGALYQLTHDHTLVQAMVERGVLTREEAATHNLRHVIANAVGGKDPGVEVELHKLLLEPCDQILVCSDGLTGMVGDSEIAATLNASPTPEQACERLVDRANALGGKDNITVIVAHCDPV